MDKFTLKAEATRKAILSAHQDELLGYQVGSTLCRYNYGDIKEGAGCAIGVALPPELRRTVPQSKRLNTYDMEHYIRFDDSKEREWHIRAQMRHDECLFEKNKGGDTAFAIERFLAHVRSEP